jgi:hypothetical protein
MVSAGASVGVDCFYCGRHHQWRYGGAKAVQQHDGAFGCGDIDVVADYGIVFVCAAIFCEVEGVEGLDSFWLAIAPTAIGAFDDAPAYLGVRRLAAALAK